MLLSLAGTSMATALLNSAQEVFIVYKSCQPTFCGFVSSVRTDLTQSTNVVSNVLRSLDVAAQCVYGGELVHDDVFCRRAYARHSTAGTVLG